MRSSKLSSSTTARPRREGLQQRQHQRRGGLLRIPVPLPQPPCGLVPGAAGTGRRTGSGSSPGAPPTGSGTRSRPRPARRGRRAAARPPAPSAAGTPSRSCPPRRARPPSSSAARPRAGTPRSSSDLHVPVLEIGRRGHRRRVHELRPRRTTVRPLRLPLALQPGRDPLLGRAGRGRGSADQPLLLADPPAQLRDLLLGSAAAVLGSARGSSRSASASRSRRSCSTHSGLPVHADTCAAAPARHRSRR